MRWKLLHTTRFSFPAPVLLGPHEIRLRPDGPLGGEVENYRLRLWPQPGVHHWRQDLWNNQLFQTWFPGPTSQLTIVNEFYYRPRATNPFNFTVEKSALHPPIQLETTLHDSLAAYLALPEAADWVEPWLNSDLDSVYLLLALNRWVGQNITYEIRPEPGVQSLQTTLRRGRGSCRDTAWLLTLGLRRLGYPSRFVSGYWLQVENDAAELHAWCEAYLPGAGWLGLDPVAGLLVSNQHLPLARGPSPHWAAPVTGSHDGDPAAALTQFRVRVRRC